MAKQPQPSTPPPQLRKCKKCGRKNPATAAKCAHCGAPIQQWGRLGCFALLILAFIAVIGFTVFSVIDAGKKPAEQTPQGTEAPLRAEEEPAG